MDYCKDKYVIITYINGDTERIDNYISHRLKGDMVEFYLKGGSSKSIHSARILDLNINVVLAPPVAVEHITINVKIKKDDKMKQKQFDELAEWFKGRFDGIKTITRVERKDKVIKGADGEPTGEIRKGGIFTTVLLDNGGVGVVTVQEGSEDNAELGILWAYTKANEKYEKDQIKKTFDNAMSMMRQISNPCRDIASNLVMDMDFGGRRDDPFLIHIEKYRAGTSPYTEYVANMLK